jgi:hypothetical protein
MLWLISFLPDWFFHVIILLGIISIVVASVIKKLPTLYTYSFVAYFTGLVLIVSGVWFEGGLSEKAKWASKVKELEGKVQVAESRSRETNTIIQTEVVEKIKVVKEKVYVNKQTNEQIAGAQLDSKCVVPESTVVLLNSASQNEVARGPSSTDGSASNVRASDVVETVIENYGRYNELREKLIGWQKWYLEQKKIFEEANK